ncbi:D-alanyl-D-alanine carboxypeptidase family protein [Paenibacillus phoenicis]|uniref:D-alanyl-D-alanine carboxypeptidase family protein n=1 Tax=Paenibacillus phoenicis TaxID=554117 RepID=A0ABU5PJ16_9BACL|nr:D-alanyl-D-alanine carboxypeptidase family protein [Paenibacillus phoenicis]MEA3569938.1 D-alanyl-D-alanine carboxypeptidase family protein [Paenibacillus phoenicis]
MKKDSHDRRFRTLCRLLAAVLLLAWVNPQAVQAAPAAPSIHAQAAAVIDVTSGRLLYSLQGDDELPIASLTKIMTAIVAIEHGKLSDTVTVGKNAYGKEGSSLYLHLGEEMSLENMLYGLMLRSGNDAATAIAEHVGGSEEGFVYLMNEKAKLLGLTHTHFQNPHGLDAEGHYSSANDLAKLTSYALKNPHFKEIVRTPSKTAPNPNDPWDYKWLNKNKMLRFYDGADGVKTGYTKTARRCLVSSATRKGQQIAVVTLNDGDDWNDHRKLLDYGFANFPLTTLIGKGQEIENSLVTGAEFKYALAPEEVGQIERRLKLVEARTGSFGYRGRISVRLKGEEIGTVPVYDKVSYNPSLMERGSEPNVGGAFGFASDHKVIQLPSDWSGALKKVLQTLLFDV